MPLPLLFPLVPMWTGLGAFAMSTIVFSFVFVFTIPFIAITFLQRSHPSPLVSQIIALARTLAVTSIVVGVLAGMVGGGGLGSSLNHSWQTLDYARISELFWEIVLLTLIADILLGLIQRLLGSKDGLF